MDFRDNFESAVSVQKSAKWRKIQNPGCMRFMKRSLQRFRAVPKIEETPLFFGKKMNVVLPEVISEAIYTYGYFDEEVTRLVLSQVGEGETVLDVGAHFGYFSLLLSNLVGKAGRVYCFEPTPSTFAILSKNAALTTNVIATNAAAGLEAGDLQLTDYGLRYCAWNTLHSESKYEEVLDKKLATQKKVQVLKLDDFVKEHSIVPSFIKIDTENFEWDVIQGLSNTIQTYRPKILLETGEKSLLAGKWLSDLNYEPWAILSNCLQRSTLELAELNSKVKDILYLPSF